MIPYNNFKSIKKRQYAYKVLYFEDKWLHQLYDIKYPCCHTYGKNDMDARSYPCQMSLKRRK